MTNPIINDDGTMREMNDVEFTQYGTDQAFSAQRLSERVTAEQVDIDARTSGITQAQAEAMFP